MRSTTSKAVITPWYKALRLRPRKEFLVGCHDDPYTGEKGSRGNGRRRRGMERGGGGVYDFLCERAYLPQPFSERPCTSMYVGSNFATKPDCVYASRTVPV